MCGEKIDLCIYSESLYIFKLQKIIQLEITVYKKNHHYWVVVGESESWSDSQSTDIQ